MESLAEMAKATAPRKFELAAAITAEEAFAKLQPRAAAFQMPFELKKGIGGPNITFKKEQETDIIISVSFKENEVKVTPILQENKTSVGVGGMNMRVDKNSLAQKGVKGVMDLPMQRGAYIDTVTETIKKILNGEEVPDYVAPVVEAPAAAQGTAASAPAAPKSWMVALLLCLFLGGFGAHNFYAGKTGLGILYLFTGGLCGIGWLIDLIKIITGKFVDKNGNALAKN